MLGSILVFFVGFPSIYGQETDPTGTKVGTEIQQSDLATPPIPNSVELVSKLLQSHLKKELRPIGIVDDAAFDLETEHLALLIVSNGETGESKRYSLLPFIPGDQLIQFNWEKKLTLQSQPRSVARAEVAELYRNFKKAVYWSDFAKKKLQDTNMAFDEKDFALTFYSSLKALPVVDSKGSIVGKLVDMAIKNSNGEILYVVLESDDKAKRAIPLGAFVSEKGEENWSIELDKEQILKFKPFVPEVLPSRVDRGWDEYVAVRYGRGGIQSAKKVQ